MEFSYRFSKTITYKTYSGNSNKFFIIEQFPHDVSNNTQRNNLNMSDVVVTDKMYRCLQNFGNNNSNVHHIQRRFIPESPVQKQPAYYIPINLLLIL